MNSYSANKVLNNLYTHVEFQKEALVVVGQPSKPGYGGQEGNLMGQTWPIQWEQAVEWSDPIWGNGKYFLGLKYYFFALLSRLSSHVALLLWTGGAGGHVHDL